MAPNVTRLHGAPRATDAQTNHQNIQKLTSVGGVRNQVCINMSVDISITSLIFIYQNDIQTVDQVKERGFLPAFSGPKYLWLFAFEV